MILKILGFIVITGVVFSLASAKILFDIFAFRSDDISPEDAEKMVKGTE